eukprot:GFYU01005760.1.p1 GENE.GFYU01005760.1~~GFYU01005760.1.p1  ORF type:complete len:119 (-),score=30.07 GFYU01005760.1:46-402(-)
MYGSPLVVIKKVITSKSVESMPFLLSFTTTLLTASWFGYAITSEDVFVLIPNVAGVGLAVTQLVLYSYYWSYERDVARSQEKDEVDVQAVKVGIVDVSVSSGTTDRTVDSDLEEGLKL